jgi:hypothetical protein
MGYVSTVLRIRFLVAEAVAVWLDNFCLLVYAQHCGDGYRNDVTRQPKSFQAASAPRPTIRTWWLAIISLGRTAAGRMTPPGGGKWVETAEKKFWRCVESGEPLGSSASDRRGALEPASRVLVAAQALTRDPQCDILLHALMGCEYRMLSHQLRCYPTN